MTDDNFVYVSRTTVEDARRMVKEDPTSYEAQGLLGELLYQNGRYSESIEYLRKGAELLQKHIENEAAKGDEPVSIGFSPKMTIKVLQSLYNMWGDASLRVERFDEARKAFEQSVKIVDDDPDAWYLLGIAQANSNRIERAPKSLREALRHNPTRHDIWEILQRVYRRLRRPEAEDINPVLRSKRDLELDLSLLAELFISGGEYDKAQLVIDKLLEWDRDDIRGLLPLAKLRLVQRSLEDAVDILEQIIEKDEHHEVALWHLGRAFCMLGDESESLRILDLLLEISSEHHNAKALKALLEMREAAEIQSFSAVLMEQRQTLRVPDGQPQPRSTQYTAYPALTLPLGSTIEDASHCLVNDQVEHFTDDDSLQQVLVHLTDMGNQTFIQTSAFDNETTYPFNSYEPGRLSSMFLERELPRGYPRTMGRTELLHTGDVVLFSLSPLSHLDRILHGFQYSSIVKKAIDEKITKS